MTYGELQTQFTAFLNRRDLTSTLRDSFISMGIGRIQRELRAPLMETTVTYTVDTEDYSTLPIPDDYLALVSISIVDYQSKLQRVDLLTAESMALNQGTPKVFARQGTSWVLGPRPTIDTEIRVDYFAEFEELVDSDDENTLTISAPDLIIYAALVFAANYYLDRRLEAFEASYQMILSTIQGQANFDELSNAIMYPCTSYEDDD
jgi:hypothetical protein